MSDSCLAAAEQVRQQGFAVLRDHLPRSAIDRCREGFLPYWERFLRGGPPSNRGPHRYFLAMPFERPWFSPAFFVDPDILRVVRAVMDGGVVADQFGCDVPLAGSEYQRAHVDYAHPLFREVPDLVLPPFALVVSFGLGAIGPEDGPIEIAAGTHSWPRSRADAAIASDDLRLESVHLAPGDVLIRNPWALHRGTPNRTQAPRFLVSIRYVRRWYADDSREVEAIPRALWESLPTDCRQVMRFPVCA
jgi:ectoine hydroxylase-related dioxygenase (phytanoyl-CoA dioxygenase family)